MPVNETQITSIKNIMDPYIEKIRPPEKIRPELDIAYKIEGQSVLVLEIRPQWNDPTIFNEHSLAKATFVKTKNNWKIFWKKSDGKWHSYSPKMEVKTLIQFIKLIEEDDHHCFWG